MSPFPFLLSLIFLFAFLVAAEPPRRHRDALLAFHSAVPHSPRLRWPSSSPTCSWLGITCDSRNTSIVFLRLPGLSLRGPFPNSTISLISSLRVISLRSNALSGPLPDFSTVPVLRALYLHGNRFSSFIPSSFSQLPRLQRLDLSANNLTGPIPDFLSNLTVLNGLFLSNNSLRGPIPATLFLPKLQHLSLAYNFLNGSIPSSLSGFPASSFAGNPDLCGRPLQPCSPPPPPVPENHHHGGGLSKWLIFAISLAGALAILALLLLIVCCCIRKRRRSSGGEGVVPKSSSAPLPRISSGTTTTTTTGAPEKSRLVFLGEWSTFGFDLEDLLRASAEILGKGSMGTSYKAMLDDGVIAVVVKRLKDVSASKKEFELRVEALGGLRHPNLAPLRAYYYSKDEKLIVTEHISGGSLSASLHGARGTGLAPLHGASGTGLPLLDWLTRLRIARAVARGLAHLHRDVDVVHGNVKASNVLLRLDPDASVLADYGLSPLIGVATGAAASRAAGYHAPEVVQTRKSTAKSDVYSYGVVVLELLTGKSPQHAAAAGEGGVDLPRWVQSVVREEWTAEVFDAEMVCYGGREAVEEEMVQLLQVAMACVALAPDARPMMEQVERMVGEITEKAEKREALLKPSSDEEPASRAESNGVTAAATP